MYFNIELIGILIGHVHFRTPYHVQLPQPTEQWCAKCTPNLCGPQLRLRSNQSTDGDTNCMFSDLDLSSNSRPVPPAVVLPSNSQGGEEVDR